MVTVLMGFLKISLLTGYDYLNHLEPLFFSSDDVLADFSISEASSPSAPKL